MCTGVHVDGQYIDEAQELSRWLGTPVLLESDCDWDTTVEQCLCNVNVEKMAENAGYDVWGVDEIGDLTLIKK